MLPLYQGAELARNLKADAHKGLWWSRFFGGFLDDFKKPSIKKEKERFIKSKNVYFSEICKKNCGDAEQLAANALRQVSLFTALGGVHSCYQTQGRFVTGMGNDHPTENGFTWHPTLGVPYLPASSVKGLVRGWLEWQWGADALQKNGDAQKRQQLLNWFGSEHKDPREQCAEHQAGWFIFFDALPISPVTLAADVMTPHYGKWYENGGDEKENTKPDTVPADWHSPVPVTFLTVKKATFQFGIAVRAGLKSEDKATAQAALPQVLAVLQDALEWAGAGAKTATGYGRMLADEEANKENAQQHEEAERKKLLASLSPNQQQVEAFKEAFRVRAEQLRGNKDNANTEFHNKARQLAKIALEDDGWTSEEKIAAAQAIEEWLPKVVRVDIKDEKKKLKLGALQAIN